MYSLKTYIHYSFPLHERFRRARSWQVCVRVCIFGGMGCCGIRVKGKVDHPPGDVRAPLKEEG